MSENTNPVEKKNEENSVVLMAKESVNTLSVRRIMYS